MTGWEPDILPGYWQCTIPLGPDPAGEGDIAATLIRRGPESGGNHAVLAVHGYTDYFFNTALADHFVAPRLRLLCAGHAEVRPVPA